MAYFIEVTKMAGVKTYFGKDLEEIFYPLNKVKAEWGFTEQSSADHHIDEVNARCVLMGMAIAAVSVVEK